MVLSLLRLLGSSYKGRARHDNWELIGQETHKGSSVDSVPNWVLHEVGRRARKHSSSMLGLQTFYMKGRRSRYKVTFRSIAPPDMYVYRRRT